MDLMEVKYRDLLRQLRRIAAEQGGLLSFVREGSNHEVWELAGERIVIPRHREINELTAQAIIDRAQEATRHDEA